MIVSEEEAKTKLCPERCYASLRVLCEGTNCMAFRVVKIEQDTKPWSDGTKTVYGYCGLAGAVYKRRWNF